MTLAALLLVLAQDVSVGLEARVGLTARIGDLVLAGSELEVAPLERAHSLVVRITRVAPHGDAFRYDLEVVGLDPGTFDLAAFLRRKDGSPIGSLSAPSISVRTDLASGQVRPHAPEEGNVPSLGGYATAAWVAGGAWLAGLVILLWMGRRRRALAELRARPKTLAERLEPLVQRALEGRLDPRERAALELSLVALWSRRLGWSEDRPEQVLVRLREHDQAGPLLKSLEQWLHAPAPAQVDLGALLAPYRRLPAEELQLELDRPASA